jgi:hypothetical protein
LKKIIAILLILIVLILPMQAEANPMLGSAVLTNPYVLGAAAVICGAGLVISSNEQLQQDITNLWNTASDTVAGWIKGQVDSGTGRMDLATAPPEVWSWVQGITVPETVNLVDVPSWPLKALEFPISRYANYADAKLVMSLNTNFTWLSQKQYPANYKMVVWASSTAVLSGGDYIKLIGKYYSGETLVKETITNIVLDASGSTYKEHQLWWPSGGDLSIAPSITKVKIYMSLINDRGTIGQNVTVRCGGFAYGYYNDTVGSDSDKYPYNDSRLVWGDNLQQVVIPDTSPKVGTVAIPETTDQLVGKDVIQTPTVNIVNIYNQTVPLSTSTPATLMPDPDTLEQGFSFLGTLIRPLTAEVSKVKTAFNEYASTNTAIDWSPITGLTYSFTNKFPFSLPWDIQRAVGSLTVTQDLPDIQVQFYNPAGGSPIQFTLDWPDFVSTFALWVRSAFLIIFGIGLVYSTNKLLGGAK